MQLLSWVIFYEDAAQNKCVFCVSCKIYEVLAKSHQLKKLSEDVMSLPLLV